MEVLNEIYTSADSPGGFSSVANLLREAKKRDPSITRKKVQDFLESMRTYTLFRGRRERYPRLKTIPICWMSDLQVDLAIFPNLATHNRGYHYLLVGVDVLSRQMFGVPLKTSKKEEMKDAFEKLFKQMPKVPQRVYSDRGKEFTSAYIKAYFKDKEVQKIESLGGVVKAAVAERAIRTIKGRIYRYFSEKNTHNWVDVLPRVLHAINHTVCRVTKMRPVDVNQDNWKSLWDRLYAPCFEESNKPPRYKVGDHVRIDMFQGKFGRGFYTQMSDEIFTIAKCVPGGPHRPTYYKLVDRKGESIDGVFYDVNLCKTKGYGETTHEYRRCIEHVKGEVKKNYLFLGLGILITSGSGLRNPIWWLSMMFKLALGRLSIAFLLLLVLLTIFYVGFLFSSPRTVSNLFYCCSHMGRTYCVIIPLHPEKRTHGGFYVRLPKHLKFDGLEWECGLHGLVYRHVWPPALVEPETHMDLHLENGEKYRIPVQLDEHLTPGKLREAIFRAGETAVERFFQPERMSTISNNSTSTEAPFEEVTELVEDKMDRIITNRAPKKREGTF